MQRGRDGRRRNECVKTHYRNVTSTTTAGRSSSFLLLVSLPFPFPPCRSLDRCAEDTTISKLYYIAQIKKQVRSCRSELNLMNQSDF